MKTKIILITIILLILVSTAYAQPLQGCEIRITCGPDEHEVAAVTAQGHFNQTGTQSMAPYKLCCPSNWGFGHGEPTFSYAPSTGHVGNPGTYSNNVLLGFQGSIKPSCSADEACVFKVSNQGHIASCDTPNHPMQNNFPNSLCLTPIEICDDSIDNTGDGLIDCASPTCYPSSENVFTPQECTGNNQTTDDCVLGIDSAGNPIYSDHCLDDTGTPFYCSYGDGDDGSMTGGRGFCCPAGERAVQDPFTGAWRCESFQQCGLAPYECKFDFDDFIFSWLGSVYSPANPGDWCVSQVPYLYNPESDVDMSTGCCYIPKYGGVGYYLDEQNVKIFGFE